MAAALSSDFNEFIHQFFEAQLAEVLADAATLYVDTEFGDDTVLDGDFAADLALRLMQRQELVNV